MCIASGPPGDPAQPLTVFSLAVVSVSPEPLETLERPQRSVGHVRDPGSLEEFEGREP